jgi:hypothetical protein
VVLTVGELVEDATAKLTLNLVHEAGELGE